MHVLKTLTFFMQTETLNKFAQSLTAANLAGSWQPCLQATNSHR
jgi:hypothetical protein